MTDPGILVPTEEVYLRELQDAIAESQEEMRKDIEYGRDRTGRQIVSAFMGDLHTMLQNYQRIIVTNVDGRTWVHKDSNWTVKKVRDTLMCLKNAVKECQDTAYKTFETRGSQTEARSVTDLPPGRAMSLTTDDYTGRLDDVIKDSTKNVRNNIGYARKDPRGRQPVSGFMDDLSSLLSNYAREIVINVSNDRACTDGEWNREKVKATFDKLMSQVDFFITTASSCFEEVGHGHGAQGQRQAQAQSSRSLQLTDGSDQSSPPWAI